MSYIFISHATADDAVVDRITAALKAAGIETWVDHQRGIAPGDVWSRDIQQAANDCQYGLFVLSPASVKSDYCEAEWNRILALKKKLYVAQVERVPLADYPLRLGIIQYSDLTADFDGGMAELIRVIPHGADLNPAAPTTKRGRRITGRIDPRLTTIPMSGRDADLAEVLRLLHDQPVAILGVGGLGKSRLAAEVARTDEQAQGAVWHVASDISRADEVIGLLRDHFDLPNTTDPRDVLKKLRETPTLVVIDNAVSVEEGDRRTAYVELIADLVNDAAQVLITGRAEWEDLPLVYPYHPQQLELEAATKIVLDMAQAFGAPDLSAQAEALAKAARQHPWLIEWAVRKTAKFPPDKVIRELGELKSARIQEALDEMIRKTVRDMVEAEGAETEAALKRLNVCRGGFSYEAARAILFSKPELVKLGFEWDFDFAEKLMSAEDDALDARLTELQAWQFVTLRNARYEIDPLVIAAAGEDEGARRPHYDYYLAQAQQHHQRQDYYGLDADSANLEAAFEWAMQTDAEAAYWLYNACSDFLANRGRSVQRMDWIKQVVVTVADYPDDRLRAATQNSLGLAFDEHPFGKRADNLRRAVAAFQEALKHLMPQSAPLDYAITQNNLGNAYNDLAALENHEDNLRRAVVAYQEALKYRTPQSAPLAYAMTQNNLGVTYSDLAALEDREGNLRRALDAYQEALKYRTAQSVPLAYAATQDNLGNVYSKLSALEDSEGNLRRAVAAYQEALKYRTPQSAPLAYATTQNNLGATYAYLAALEDRAVNLRRAVAAYQEALRYYTPQSAPYYYAGTQRNLGIALQASGDLPAAGACWREAEKYYRLIGIVDDADKMVRAIAELEQRINAKSKPNDVT